MAQYAILLYSPAPADPMDMGPEDMEAHEVFQKEVSERNIEILNPQALTPSTDARAVKDGTVTDGTFVEAKEVLAGFFFVEADSVDEATEIAKLVPTKKGGGVEVRPVFVPPSE
ncbi:YciI family protein [Haloechinothrix halophila]|uniref:YciI family protein n=1 Tax=Haloechinothrix halophila TaxID=1069073 RepID=UPI0004118A31|nr:YciI family protein [Haloechinothrix halophila]